MSRSSWTQPPRPFLKKRVTDIAQHRLWSARRPIVRAPCTATIITSPRTPATSGGFVRPHTRRHMDRNGGQLRASTGWRPRPQPRQAGTSWRIISSQGVRRGCGVSFRRGQYDSGQSFLPESTGPLRRPFGIPSALRRVTHQDVPHSVKHLPADEPTRDKPTSAAKCKGMPRAAVFQAPRTRRGSEVGVDRQERPPAQANERVVTI